MLHAIFPKVGVNGGRRASREKTQKGNWEALTEGPLLESPIIIIKKETAEGPLVESPMPYYQVFDNFLSIRPLWS